MPDPDSPRVTMYTASYCGYCVRAERLLAARGVDDIAKIRVDHEPAERMAMMKRTGRRTVPQIYIGERHVGGYDDLVGARPRRRARTAARRALAASAAARRESAAVA